MLAGGNAGKIFVDDPAHPTCACVWEADDGTLYLGGRQDREALRILIDQLRQEALVALTFRDGDPIINLFPENPTAGAACLEFDRSIGASDLTPFLTLPDGFTLRRMDAELLDRCSKKGENFNRYGSLDNFLEKGLAVCILRGEEIVCEAYADMDVMGRREIGISTQKEYRHQGLATAACAHLIKLCEAVGSAAYWDCVRLNLVSAALARRLGFGNERDYKVLAWFKTGAES